MEYLEPLDLIEINARETGVPGGTAVDPSLVYAAAMRPRAHLFGTVTFPDPITAAAALLVSVVTWHPFAQENSATAITAEWSPT